MGYDLEDKNIRKKSREHRKMIGELGEDIASIYLRKNGFEIIERNYWKKWGEIDIVARKNRLWHFVEVKTVSREIPEIEEFDRENVIHETDGGDFRPEDNLHPWKIKRINRAIQSYLMEKGLDEVDWQIDIVTIKLDMTRKRSRVNLMENVL